MLPPSTATTRSWLAALALASLSRVVSAEPDTDPSAQLEVSAGSECGSRDDLVARVHARAPRIRFVDEASELKIQARFLTLPTGRVEGVLVLTPEGGEPVTRRLVARSCAEAADGLALIIAVALGQAVSPPPTDEARPGDPGSNERAGTAATTRSDTARRDARRDQGASPPDGVAPGDDSPPESEESASFALEVGLFAQGLVGPAPKVLPGVSLHVLAGLDSGVLAPAAALGVTHAARSGLSQPGGRAVFLLDGATIDLCPLKFQVSAVDVRPCGAALVARLAASGRATRNAPGTIARPFATAGGSLLVRGRFGWMLEPSLRATVGANLIRDSFTFTPVVFHRVPPLSASVSVGLGIRAY